MYYWTNNTTHTLDGYEIHDSNEHSIWTQQMLGKKMQKNIEKILYCVNKLKLNQSKKYQISGWHEWKMFKKILWEKASTLNISFQLEKDDKQTRNILNIGSDYCRCIHCINPNDTIKVSVMYVHIKKIDLGVYFYRILKYFREKVYPELMEKVWHPNRFSKWKFEITQ